MLWEPMGDGKRLISLADNHALLWDLQESSTQATVREKHTHMHTHRANPASFITHYLITTMWSKCLNAHILSLQQQQLQLFTLSLASYKTHMHIFKRLFPSTPYPLFLCVQLGLYQVNYIQWTVLVMTESLVY